MKDYGMYQGYNIEGANDVNISSNQEIDINTPATNNAMGGCTMPEVVECPREREIHRTICHTVPHVCPINTKIINHHVYRHIYRPCYTCCEENVVCNIDPGCNNFF